MVKERSRNMQPGVGSTKYASRHIQAAVTTKTAFWHAFNKSAEQNTDSPLHTLVKKAAEKIPGGKAGNLPDRVFNKKTLDKGTDIESEEHADGSKEVGKEVAKDHIVEHEKEKDKDQKLDSDYYKELPKMEKKLEKSSSMQDFYLDKGI